MAESFKHMATCACGAVGDIVDRGNRFDFKDNWFVIQHEGDVQHRVKLVNVDGKFRFKHVGGTQ